MAKKLKVKKSKTSKLKKTILGIAIALILVFFLGYAVNTFYEPPKSEQFCKDIPARIEVDSCEGHDELPQDRRIPREIGEKDCFCREVDKEGTMQCDKTNPEYNKCWEEYDGVREDHGRVSFIILVILGLASILIGGLVLKVEAVASGMMGGGVLTLLYAAIRFWGSIQDYGRLFVLGIALVVLVWIGYKKLKD